jgi:hypothetical protein
VRNIGGEGEDEEGAAGEEGKRPEEASYMDVDVDVEEPPVGREPEQQQDGEEGGGGGGSGDDAAKPAAAGKQRNYRKKGGWVTAEEEEQAGVEAGGGAAARQQQNGGQVRHRLGGNGASGSAEGYILPGGRGRLPHAAALLITPLAPPSGHLLATCHPDHLPPPWPRSPPHPHPPPRPRPQRRAPGPGR